MDISNRDIGKAMPRKKRGGEKSEATSLNGLDVYEKWLERQPVKRVKARSGFISAEEKEAGS
jgi:hypothetical protein